jgi:hypothetical protein
MSEQSESVKSPLHKLQAFVMERWPRERINAAVYNPRMITENARKKLDKRISTMGLVMPLVVNRRTRNLVAGHQRLDILDKKARGKEYELDLAVIDVDERTEKELNVFLNNPGGMGEWDLDKLAALNLDEAISFDEMGFDKYDVDMLFDGDSRFSDFFTDDEEVKKTGAALEKVKEARKQSKEKLKERNDAQFYFVVVCKDQAEKEVLMKKIGMPAFEQFVPGDYLNEQIGEGGYGRK